MSTSTSLVLGSGGARGLTHIGVIRCLEERGYDIRYVAGSSIGALVGGIHAAGKLDVYADWVEALERSDIVRLLDWSLDGASLFKGERIIGVVRELVGARNIEDLEIGFTAVATDLAAGSVGREVWFSRGPLFDAIRASIATPTIFAPVRDGKRLLVDGGVVNPVPVAPTLNDHTQITIAVDLNGPARSGPPMVRAKARESRETPLRKAYRENIGQYLDQFWPSSDDDEPKPERVGFAEVITRSMEAMQATITQFKLAAHSPAVVIRIPRTIASFFDFDRAGDLIQYGYERAAAALDDYEQYGPALEKKDGGPIKKG